MSYVLLHLSVMRRSMLLGLLFLGYVSSALSVSLLLYYFSQLSGLLSPVKQEVTKQSRQQ